MKSYAPHFLQNVFSTFPCSSQQSILACAVSNFSVINSAKQGDSTTGEVSVMPEPGGARGATGPPIFGRSVNPILTGEGRLSPTIASGTPIFFTFRYYRVSSIWFKKLMTHNIGRSRPFYQVLRGLFIAKFCIYRILVLF